MVDVWTVLLPLLRWMFYPAMLLAVGGVGFDVLMRPWIPAAIGHYLRRITTGAGLAAMLLAMLQLPVVAGSLGGDLASAADPYLLTLVLDTPAGLASLVAAGGLALLLVVERAPAMVPGVVRLMPPAMVIISMTLVGHATSHGLLTAMLLSLHLAGIGFWLAALLPLRRMCVTNAGDGALAILSEEFGRLALVLVAMLVVAGICYAALLLGSVAALFTTSYGIVLLAKLVLVGGMLLLAAVNRFRLVPALHENAALAAPRLRRSIEMEMGVAGLILLASSLLTTSVTLPMGGMS
ncbi:MAG: CopD family protein [Candidatus Puniceispirillaceae bacterium]